MQNTERKRPLPKRKPVVSKADWKNKQKNANATGTIFAKRASEIFTKKPEFKLFGKKPPFSGEEQEKSELLLANRRTFLPDLHRGGDLVKQRSSTKIKHSILDLQFGAIFRESSQKNKITDIFFCYFRPTPPLLTPTEVTNKIRKLHRLCLTHLEDSYMMVHGKRLKGIKVLDKIIDRTHIQELTTIQVKRLVWCVLSCVNHFYIRQMFCREVFSWVRRSQARKAIRTYDRLIMAALPICFNTVMHAIMTFYSKSKMRKQGMEYLYAELLKRLMYISQKCEHTVDAIFDIAEETSLSNMYQARRMVRVLYQILKNYPWTDTDEYFIMRRLLTMFRRSIIPCNDKVDYAPLQKDLEICLKYGIANFPSINLLLIIKEMLQWTLTDKITDKALLNFGNVLEYAAMMHQTDLFRDSLYQDLFPLILQLVSSENRLYSLLGNHVLQHLIDRHENKRFFDTPKLFFDDIHFDIIVSLYNSEDEAFIRKYRESIHAALLISIKLHGLHRINVESTYTSIALFIVEIPCGYTATAMVCLAMAIQEYAFSIIGLKLKFSDYLHGTIMAIMSLVCRVHSAQEFYDYVKLVLSKRAEIAPILNPPLKEAHKRRVPWKNKPELFFDDWETRFSLWKHFKNRNSILYEDILL